VSNYLKIKNGSTRSSTNHFDRLETVPTKQASFTTTKQFKTEAGYQYGYAVPSHSSSGTQKKVVTEQTTDRVAGHGPAWEAGNVKIPERTDPLGRLRVTNDKVKVEYSNL
jgi:hypothetical protein